jgi:hypothetical protein
MELEKLAKAMRERALLIEGDDSLSESLAIDEIAISKAKAAKQKQVENLKKLYFNAGRWVGGARDQNAREAFVKMKAREV